jgi:predicted phosphohydrolase
MKLRIMSDLHLEHYRGVLPFQFEEEKDTILVLAGDICPFRLDSMLFDFLEMVSPLYFKVLIVAGNHEYYGSFMSELESIKKTVKENKLDNVYYLENECLQVGDITFCGATLWTDFDKGSPTAMIDVEYGLNDFRLIRMSRDNPRLLKAEDTYEFHKKSIAFMHHVTAHRKPTGKVVWIVHHGVSYQSVAPMFVGSNINCGFVSELGWDLTEMSATPDLIIHGHVHNHNDYMIGETRVISNPLGYPRENACFVVDKYVEL